MDVQKPNVGTASHPKSAQSGTPKAFSYQRHLSDETLVTDVQSDRCEDETTPRIITFDPSDPEHPNNWKKSKKFYVLATGIVSVINTVMGSSLSAGASTYILQHFNITSELQAPLPISCFLLGYTVGPVLCGPLSENYGRKVVLLCTLVLYTVFTMACAVAPTWPVLLIFRFLCGTSASGPIAIVGGLYADIYSDPTKRGMAMAFFMCATIAGPCSAPMISGFIAENASWRWVFGFGTFFALATLPFLIFLPETYVPVLLSRRAANLQKTTGEDVVAKTDLQKHSWSYLLKVVMTRPYRMLFQELIVACVCAYLALAYAIFYMYFEAYPLVFQGPDSIYRWSPGLAGVAFMPIVLGGVICGFIFVGWDSYLTKAKARNAPWTKQEEYRRLPLACVGGPLYVISLFWLGWSARSDVHWIVPTLSGIPSGMGYILIFMALLNYLSDAYETFAASAMGIASTSRSIFGALLPLGAHRMFTKLGINWACSLLAFLSMGMAIIPFAFIKWGDTIRANSKFCQELKALKQKEAEKAGQQLNQPVEQKV